MRTTIQALLCSLLATACAPIGEAGDTSFGPDAGADAASASGTCDDLETRTLDLTISGSAGFTNLPAGCWKLNGRLTLTGPAVTSVAKLGDLRGVRDLVIDDTDLTTLDSKGPIDVTGTITIRYNDRLTDIAHVAPRATIESIAVEYNPELVSLGGLSKASVVTADTRISNNNKLVSVSLPTVNRIEGNVTIQDNPLLGTVELPALTSTGSLTVRRNALLATLTLTALQYVHGTLTIDDNDALGSLSGLNTGITVDIGVYVTNNLKLSNIDRLARASYVGGAVTVTSNAALSASAAHEIDCCVNTGPVSISNNMTSTCNGGHWCATNGCPY